MASQNFVTGFTIKLQPLGETDVILTFFSLEAGKIRAVIKSAKKMTSKLQGGLQPFIKTKVGLVGSSSLSTVIAALPEHQYSGIVENQHAMHAVLCVQEFLNRAVPDAEPNPQLFQLVEQYYQFLDTAAVTDAADLQSSLAQFFVQALAAIGLEPEVLPSEVEIPSNVYFSLTEGGFSLESRSSTDFTVSRQQYKQYRRLSLAHSYTSGTVDIVVFRVVADFVGYQFDRKLRSVNYFMS